MKTAILSNNEAKRLKALQAYHILDTLSEDEYDDISLIASHICQMPIALISLVDEFHQWFKWRQGFKAPQTQRDLSFCAHAILNPNEPLIVEDATKDPRFAANPLVTGAPNIRFYAGIPITDENNFALGTLCVMDHKPRELSAGQLESLNLLAQSVNRRLKERKQNFNLKAGINSLNCAVNTTSIVSQTDKKGKITHVNDRFIEITGYSEAELLGQDHHLLNSGHHPKSFFVEMWKTIAAGNPWRGDIKNKAKNGTCYWVDSVITPIKDLAGNVEGYLSVRNLITERKNAEQLFKKSEERFYALAKSTSNIICTMDEQGELVDYIETWTKFTGQTSDEVKHGGWAKAFHPEDKEFVQDKVGKALIEKKTFRLEARIRRKDGEWIWMEASAVPVFNDDGTLREWIGSANEINQRKIAEEETKVSKANLLEAQRIARLGSWEMNLENNQLTWSDEIFRMFEIDPTKFGATYEAYLDTIHPEDREMVNDTYTSSLKNRTPYRIEHRLKFSDGRIKYIEGQCETFYNEKGSPIISYGTALDITERKKAELQIQESQRRFQGVVDNINDGLLIDDMEGRVIFGNKRLLEMFGLTDKDLANLILEDYVAPEHRAMLRDRHNRRIAGQDVPDIFEYEGLLKDGKRRWFEARVSRVIKNGVIKGTQSAIRDITERKKTEALLNQINQVVSVKTGANYFSELTAFLCSQLEIKYAFVGNYLPETDSIESISFRCYGKELDNFTYPLTGTPCDSVIKGSTCVYPSNVQCSFPEDDDLKTLKVESYLGTQLRDENNKVVGIIVLMDDKPMIDVEEKKKIISIAAPRTTNELKQRSVLKQLKESEEKYRSLFQKMNEGLVQTSFTGTIQLVNPKYAEITGYSDTELLGQNIYELLFNIEKCTFLKDKIKQREAPISEHYEIEYLTKTGETIWVSVSDSPQYDQNGDFTGVMSIVSDITARKNAEEKTIQSQQLLQNLTDQVPGAVYQFQMYPDGRMYFPYFSKGITKLYPGLTPERIQKNAALIFEPIHPEDKLMVQTALTWSNVKLKNFSLQYRIVLPNGSIRWHAVNSVPQKQPDGSVLWHGFFTDITEEKLLQQKAEEASSNLQQQYIQILELQRKFASILNNTSDLIHSVDASGILNFVNDAWLKKLGYTSEDEVLGKSVFEFIYPECVPQCQQLLGRIKGGEQIGIAEMSFITAAGIKVDCEATINANFENGQLINAECFFRDITELKKERLEKEKMQQNALAVLEEKVLERTAEWQEANKELESFSYSVSHDLQAPLRLLSGFSTILKRNYNDSLDEQGKEFLGIVDSSAKQMSQLIHDLLHFSRLGKAPVAKKEVNMDELVSLTVNEIKNSHANFNTKIILHPLRSAPCDIGLIRQVWVNLIENAVKYSSKKENPVVEIGMQEVNGDPVYFVKDNGDGFDMKQVNRLFGVFQRLHHASEFEGTGVGLATVKRIINKHGGRVWAEGQEKQGAVFYFTISD